MVDYMPVEIKGQQLRIKTKSRRGVKKYRVHDVGKRGRLQRLAGFKKGEWDTYGWRLNLKDYKSKAEARRHIRKLRIPAHLKSQAIKKLDEVIVM